jgi:hypothetical protein
MAYYFPRRDPLLLLSGQPSSQNGQQKNLHPAPVRQQLILMLAMALGALY